VLHGAALFRVQPFEMGKRHWSRMGGAGRSTIHDSCFVRNCVFSRGFPICTARRPRIAGARDFSARASTAEVCRERALALGLAISVSNR
jgi:hypothetical protein